MSRCWLLALGLSLLDAGLFDDLRPFGDVAFDAIVQIVGRHAARIHAGGVREFLNLGRLQCFAHGTVELGDNVGGGLLQGTASPFQLVTS